MSTRSICSNTHSYRRTLADWPPTERRCNPLATYTFGDALLTVLEFAFLFLWIWIAVGVVFDIFRSSDLSNWAKALWMLLIFVFPLVGVLAYLVVRGHTMHEHETRDRAQYEAFARFTRGGADLHCTVVNFRNFHFKQTLH